MANNIIQYRFYGKGHPNNQPLTAEAKDFINSDFIKAVPILQLGIQTLPGTKFYINGNADVDPVIIGATGIYELDLDNKVEINSLRFDAESMVTIDSQSGGYLIVDIVYETKEG